MNASTPERCGDERKLYVYEKDGSGADRVYTCGLEKGHVGDHVGGALMWPVRVEEPSGEPACSHPVSDVNHFCAVHDGGRERVAQSANADVRDRAAILASAVGIARLRLQEGDAEGAKAALDDAADKTRALLAGALPVPVGDETEALRAGIKGAVNEAMAQAKRANDAEARVAGLEAREASLRDAVQDVIALVDSLATHHFTGTQAGAKLAVVATRLGDALRASGTDASSDARGLA